MHPQPSHHGLQEFGQPERLLDGLLGAPIEHTGLALLAQVSADDRDCKLATEIYLQFSKKYFTITLCSFIFSIMKRPRSQTEAISRFVLTSLDDHPHDITNLTAREFGISRQAANQHVRRLVENGLIIPEGNTRARRYRHKRVAQTSFLLAITPELEEDRVWREHVVPCFTSVRRHIVDICQYGFTEMFNNLIDHSSGKKAFGAAEITSAGITLTVNDDGIGIFTKIRQELHLADQREAILELAKGKLTTDPRRHSGEGIFFTSRMFDQFSILSDKLFFMHRPGLDDWLIEDRDERFQGTAVTMKISLFSTRRMQAVFEQFAQERDEFGFSRTHVPVVLAQYGDENLVSRSQARRVLVRFDRFKEVFLDFSGVRFIGQAFADEIFRVFRIQHPEVEMAWANANETIERMILHVAGKRD